MIDPQREPLEGVVEVDQAEIPFRADNRFFDPAKSGKILIAGAVEVIDRGTNQAKPRRKRAKYLDTRSGRIRLAAIPDNSAASIEAFARANVKPGTTLLTDGHRSYPGLTDYRHDPRTVGKMAGHIVLPWIHRVLRVDEALGARHLSWAAPQAHRHLSQRVCLPIQSALLPARLVRNHARARRTITRRVTGISSDATIPAKACRHSGASRGAAGQRPACGQTDQDLPKKSNPVALRIRPASPRY